MTNERQKVDIVTDYIFLNSQITADDDGSLEIKRWLFPWEERYDKPRQHIKSRGITLLTKVVVDIQTLSCV